jgi:hypothetical protein
MVILFLLWKCLINVMVDFTNWRIVTDINVTTNIKMAHHVIFDNFDVG